MQLESGEYFLKAHEKKDRETQQRKEKASVFLRVFTWMLLTILQQEEVAAERRAKRAEAFVAPAETAAPSVDEKRRRKREKEREEETSGHAEGEQKRKKKKRKVDAGES